MAKIKRSQVKTYMNTTPSTTATYSLLGDGVTSGLINMNPNVTNETYIHEDSATISVEGYAPTYPVEATAVASDAVFEFIDTLRKNRSVLDDAETDIVNVWFYETPSGDVYPAEKQTVSIQIDSFGGDGGQALKINYTINYVGDPTAGTWDVSDNAFTPS